MATDTLNVDWIEDYSTKYWDSVVSEESMIFDSMQLAINEVSIHLDSMDNGLANISSGLAPSFTTSFAGSLLLGIVIGMVSSFVGLLTLSRFRPRLRIVNKINKRDSVSKVKVFAKELSEEEKAIIGPNEWNIDEITQQRYVNRRKIRYRFKFYHKTRVDIFDVKCRLKIVVPSISGDDGKKNVAVGFFPISHLSEQAVLPRFKKNDDEGLYANIIYTTVNLEEYWKTMTSGKEGAYLELEVSAKHSITGFTRVKSCRFMNINEGVIVPEEFEFGANSKMKSAD